MKAICCCCCFKFPYRHVILIAIVHRKLSGDFNPPYWWCSSLQYEKELLQIYPLFTQPPNKQKSNKKTAPTCEVSSFSVVFLKSLNSKFQFRVHLLGNKGLCWWAPQRSPTGIRIHSSYLANKCLFLQMGSKLFGLTPRAVLPAEAMKSDPHHSEWRFHFK